ncbi:LuxR C-terminal-related transcriptional regulator [Arsenophonus nasoniae]|uniref:LuxR C-terminal-related transcriptional regulator n=1 Tax=Arsenophonus nasoniae TaxID=638 RepID=D2U3V9_9GAMM|nr:LuxR family transcriptional regulator [Arsenophonus nasoniae]QBY45129.1 Transcriptional activator protein EsaR [Arsenophonus nasoniae]WGM05333.1 LuxR C-terminal-related transcriptional regulator [Arsenophonus nasoniae]WGM10339.1 LuxR C-terminal-related transcriptional regulator [Arsenophonus nasoniae]WGM15054.1 LuxR C-terminal-related transcriptional regulator [Arsenophonus nasoniae]CBA76124.1 LuxR family transcriptional regulatory protein [Arsenophonus nasoniae]
MPKNFFSNTEKNNYIKQHLDKQLAKYDKVNYVYAVMNKKNTDDMIIISDLSDELVNNYLNQKTQNIDPVIIKALNQLAPFSWDENIKINSIWPVKKVFEPMKMLNISGYAFVLHDHLNNLALLSLYMDKFLIKDIEFFIKSNKGELQGLLIHTHEMLLSLYQNENTTEKIIFSPRESEVLYWCSIGKTYSEIGTILNISTYTVKFHIGNVVKKLGVINAKHAISLSVKLNLISRPAGKKAGLT